MVNKATLFGFLIIVFLLYGCGGNGTGPDNGGTDNGENTESVTADAGADENAVVGFEIEANGSASSGSETMSYSWEILSQPTNSQASLSDASTEAPGLIPDLPGEYTLSLEISSNGETDTDEVTFSAIAKRLFIDANTGNDRDTNGYLSNSPLKTFNKAIEIVEQNSEDPFLDIDTLRVAEGLYDQANGENFPMSFSGNLIVKGDQNVDRNNIHILSPDVDRDPAMYVGEGVTLRHLKIENGYTGGTFNGDPDAVFVTSGTDLESSRVILEDVTLATNNENGYIISTGSNIQVDVRDSEGARSTIDGKNIGFAYSNRFNTSNVNLNVSGTDVINIGDGGAFQVDDVSNLSLTVANSTIKPSAGKVNDYAFDLEDEVDLQLEGTTISSSDGSESGERFKHGIVMDNDQPLTNINVLNSTIQFTEWSAIKMRAAVVKVTDTIIEGIHTQNTTQGANLAHSGIDQLNGTLILRGTTIRNSKGNALTIDGPVSPNDNNFEVDLGKDGTNGNNSFEDIDGFDVLLGRSDRDVSGEVPALGNSWSDNSSSPSCTNSLPGSSENASNEVYVSDSANSLRWGTGTAEVCN